MSSCEEDVNRIKKKLEKMLKTNDIDLSSTQDMLNVLKGLQINLQILQNTRIGVVVNNLRKICNSDELNTLAKNLLKTWKKLVSSTESNGSANKSQSPTSNFDETNDKDNSNSVPTSPPVTSLQHQQSLNQPTPSSASSSSSSLNTFQFNGRNGAAESSNLTRQTSMDATSSTSTNQTPQMNRLNSHPQMDKKPSHSMQRNLAKPVTFTETKDEIRLKSRELLAQALKLPDGTDTTLAFADAAPIAARCEDIIFKEFSNTDQKYRNRIRSRIANLKDPKNPKLRESVLLGLISSEKLAVMTAEEMASDDLKQLREKLTKESIDDHQMAVIAGAKSSLLKCRKCKGSNCGFTEMQTRSADEPMTVFAYCLDCGNRWRQ